MDMENADADIAWDECIPDLGLSSSLPPLNTLSSTSSEDLPHLELLDLFPLDTPKSYTALPDTLRLADSLSSEKLSHCTSPTATPPPSTPASHVSSTSADSHSHASEPDAKPAAAAATAADPAELAELHTRLSAAGSETSALRKRVASLAAENRALRHALDHANARLVAVAQAAAAHPPPPPPPPQVQSSPHLPAQPQPAPVVMGLAHVSADMAHRLAGALTVAGAGEEGRDRKKRKRVTGAATTMACVMFMWGALVGTPGLLKSGSGSYRSDANLPAVWTSTETAVAPTVPRLVGADVARWEPNCMRMLQQLPNGSEGKEDVDMVEVKEESSLLEHEIERRSNDKDADTAGKAMFVDMANEKAADTVEQADTRAVHPTTPEYSYVLCRDAQSAVANVKSCAQRMQKGETCGQPHTISLIMPAAAAGMDGDNDTVSGVQPALAEVQCSILSVARIPGGGAGTAAGVADKGAGYGKVIASVREGTEAATGLQRRD